MATSPPRMRAAPTAGPEDAAGRGDAADRWERLRSGALAGLVRRASDRVGHGTGADQALPVLSELRGLLPEGGLRRGTAVALGGPRTGEDLTAQVSAAGPAAAVGTTSLLTALLAGPSRAGSWCAVVGMPAFGAVAAEEAGVCLDRLALVPYPGVEWTSVVAALLDGIDVVAVQPPGPAPAAAAQRLAARARQRGSVLVPVGMWPGADLTMTPLPMSGPGAWEGTAQGRGRLRRRKVEVVARGRGSGARPRRVQLWLPASAGGVAAVASAPVTSLAVDTRTGRPDLPPAEPAPVVEEAV